MPSRRQFLRTTALTGATVVVGGVTQPLAGAKPLGNPPRPEGVVHPKKPFLRLPFRESLAKNLKVTQGWGVEKTEAGLIGPGNHSAIDFEGYPYGAPILAAASGWANYSYQRLLVLGVYKDPISGREVSYIDQGAGLFVEITHDKTAEGVPGNPRWTTQYIHLATVAAGIPCLSSIPAGSITAGDKVIDNWDPIGLRRPQGELVTTGKYVRQGEVIGTHGDTGIGADWYDDWDPITKTVHPRDRALAAPWDPQGGYDAVPLEWSAQLHFNLYAGRGADGQQGMQNRIDPFDLYAGSDLGILPGSRYDNPYMKGSKPYAGPPHSLTALERHGVNLLFAG